MDKKIIGTIFFLIFSIFFCTRYISAAISGINSKTWSKGDFITYLSYVPNNLIILSYISLALGFIYFVWGIIVSKK